MLIYDGAVGVLTDQVCDIVRIVADDGVGGHREEHVGNAGGFNEVDEIALEIADVQHVDLLEGACVERNLRVAEAILDDEQLAAVLHLGIHLDDIVVAAEEHHVGVGGIHLGEEIAAVLVVESGVIEIGLILGARHVVFEILGVIFQAGVLREAVQRADIARVHALLVGGEIGKGHAGGLREGARRVIGAERLPVVVGAQVDILLRVFLHYIDHVDRLDAAVQLGGDAVEAFGLIGNVFQCILRRVDGACSRRGHGPDRHIRADFTLQVIERSGIICAAATAERLHAAPMVVPVDHQEVVYPFERAVALGGIIALVGLRRGAAGLHELRKDLTACHTLKGVRRRGGRRRGLRFVVIRRRGRGEARKQAHTKGRFHLVAHVLEAVVIGHRVVVKSGDAGGEFSGKIALQRKGRKFCEASILNLRRGGARKNEQEDRDQRKDEQTGTDGNEREPGL